MIDPTRLIAGASAVYGEEAFVRDFGGLTPVPEGQMIVAPDGLDFHVGSRTLTFFDTPGHANHHGCIYDARTNAFFTGDTFGISYREFDWAAAPWLFAPTTPVAFDPDAWLQSVDKLMALKPEAMYLTHYSRVDDPASLVATLRQSIRDMAAIALAEQGHDDPERGNRLKQAVRAHLTASARGHGVDLDDGEIADLLAVDTELNAQGLEVWLKRREKHGSAHA